jgi:hypothetical protein
LRNLYQRREGKDEVNDVSSPKEPKSANSPAVDTVTLDIIQQSPVVESVDPAHLSYTGKASLNIHSESTGFNRELHALLQHVYSKIPLDINFGTSSGEAGSSPPSPNNEVLVKVNDVASDALLPESTNMDVNNDAPPPQHMEKRNYFSIYL